MQRPFLTMNSKSASAPVLRHSPLVDPLPGLPTVERTLVALPLAHPAGAFEVELPKPADVTEGFDRVHPPGISDNLDAPLNVDLILSTSPVG